MRKDVKFGLTIGAILVATLVVYCIVLSRGGTAPPGSATAIKAPSAPGVGSDPADPNAPLTPDHNADSNAAKPDAAPTTPVAPVTSADASGPSTKPATDAWLSALNNGLPMSMSASAEPEHTMTPMIDSPSSSTPHFSSNVTRDKNVPVIDVMPSTRPTSTVATANPKPGVSVANTPVMIDVPAPGNTDGNVANTGTVAPIVIAPTRNIVPATTVNGQRTHRVANGETLSKIAAAAYGDAKYYKRILASNPGVDAKHLKIGQTLILPEVNDDSEKGNSTASSAAPAPATIDPATSYKVVSGDTLEKIARHLYGSPVMKDKLYAANKSLIGADENVLKVGWVLKLPQTPTVASASH